MRLLLLLLPLLLLLCGCADKPPSKMEDKDESWGFVREYTDPRTGVRYLVFIRGSHGVHVIPAPLKLEK